MNAPYVRSVCPHDCPSACALKVEKLPDGRIGRVKGDGDHPFTDGTLCAKVARYGERQYHPDRLTQPLRRVGAKGEGRFAPISWDAAMDEIAERFQAAAARHGPTTVWPYRYAGTMGLLMRDGLDRLVHAMGYSRQLHTICSHTGKMALLAGQGAVRGPDPRNMAEADLIILWGINPVATSIHTVRLTDKARKSRGAKVVCIDPYATPTAELADIHLTPKPGTDGALACAIMHVLFRDGLADRDFLRDHTDFPAGLEDHLRQRSPQWAAGITGIPAESIEDLATLYGTTERSFIRMGYGMSRQRNGAAAIHAVTCLPAVSGAWKHEGAGALLTTGGCLPAPGTRTGLDRGLLEAHDLRDTSVRVLDMCRLGPILAGTAEDLHGGPPVTAMLVQNCNPATVTPESGTVRQGLLRDDLFFAVHEQFLTDSTNYADIVLPATTFLEHDDLYSAYGHYHLQVARKLTEPPGEARDNHRVISDLAKRLGASHRSFDMTAWEIIDETLKMSGYPGADDLYEMGGFDTTPDFEKGNFRKGFGHADGRFRFAPDWTALGPYGHMLPSLPDHAPLIEDVSDTFPFRLVTAPSRNFLNTSFTETPTSRKREGGPSAMLNPAACTRLGLTEADRVRIGNDLGSVVVALEPTEKVPDGVVVVESIWPESSFEEGRGINTLVSAKPIPPGGGGAFHDTAVWIRPVN